MEKINSILTRKKCSKWLKTPCILIFGCSDSNGTGFEAVHSDVFSYGLYVCIILETASHRTTFRIFCNITQNTTPEENSCKMFQISSLIVLFLMGRSRMILDKDQISSGEGKRKGERGGIGRRSPKFPLLSKIQTLFHKPLIRQTSNHHHCNWYAQKHICRDFQVILSRSSWSKTTLCIIEKKNRNCCKQSKIIIKIMTSFHWLPCWGRLCIFKEQMWLPNRKCYGKKLYFDQEEIGNAMEKIDSVLIFSLNSEALSVFLSQHLMQAINCRGQHSMCRINYRWHHSFL